MSKIRYLKHKEIDKQKWDDCIQNSYNQIIYALSWYLDCVSPDWHALVLDDYKAVMPLPVKKKYGICIIYSPYFAQQLGIFSTFSLHNEHIKAFFKAIPRKFLLIRQKINAKNDLYPIKKWFTLHKMPNYLANLYRPYEVLKEEFATNTIRNIKKARKYNFTLRFDTDIAEFFSLKQENSEHMHEALSDRMHSLLNEVIDRGAGECIGVYHENVLLAGAIILRSNNRFIMLISASSDEGKKKRAMFYLIDEFFKTHCEQKRLFDFEGSVIPGVAQFFSGFGAKPETYNYVTLNRVKYPIKKIFPFL